MPERVESSLQQVILWLEVKENLNKSTQALSGGQQQRLCIARTLAVEPSVIFINEPTSALDILISPELLEKLRFAEMYESALSMLEDIAGAFSGKDTKHARKVFKKDKLLNKINLNCFKIILKM